VAAASQGSGVDVPTSPVPVTFDGVAAAAAACDGFVLAFATLAVDPGDESPLQAVSTTAADSNRETSPATLNVMILSNEPVVDRVTFMQDD
jgi:hypothetical protein